MPGDFWGIVLILGPLVLLGVIIWAYTRNRAAGPGNVVRGMILDPVVYLRGGRRLSIPPPPGHLEGFLQRAGGLDAQHRADPPESRGQRR